MAEEKKTSTPEWFSSSPFSNHIEANAKRDPQYYYNLGVYVMLYNRIRCDLMNKNPSGNSAAFDVEINDIIKKGLSGSKAEVEAFLHKFDYDGILMTYDPDDAIETAAAKDEPNSTYTFTKEFNNIVAFSREMARAKYGKDKAGHMLTYDDVREILKMKEYRADRPYEKVRLLIDNQDFEAKGDQIDGPLFKAYKNAEQELKNMKTGIRRNRLKATGFLALSAGLGVAAGTVALNFLFPGGGGLISTLFGNLYAQSSFMGTAFGIGGTALFGAGAVGTFVNKFIPKLGQIWKDRKKYKNFKRSEGEYGNAKENEFDKMGYKRVKEKYYEAAALKKFYENYAKGKVFINGRETTLKDLKGSMSPERFARFKSKLQPWDYLDSDDLRDAIKTYLAQQAQYPNGKDAKRLFKDAGYHKFVADRKMGKDAEGFGFYKLQKYFPEGVENYETSSLSPDEVIMNYGQNGTGRLNPTKVKNGGIEYLAEQLEEFTAHRDSFAKVGKVGEYKAGLKDFETGFSDGFKTALFENAYSSYAINEANRIATTDKSVKDFFEAEGKTVGTRVQSMYSFVKSEASNTTRNPLSEDVGVGVQYQVDYSESSLVGGCATFADSTPETLAAARAIASMSGRSQESAARTAISSVTNPESKRYLQFMLDSKLKATRYDSIAEYSTDAHRGTPNSVASKIKGMTKSSEADSIRSLIISNISNSTEQSAALRQLDQQVSTLETKVRDEARVKAMGGVQEGSDAFADVMKEISDLSDRDQGKIFTLIDKKIKKIKPTSCYDYLMLKLKDKIKKNFEEFARNSNNLQVKDGNYAAALNDIRTFLNELFVCTANGYIDAWQRDAIMDLVKERINNAFDSYLLDFERYFLTDEKQSQAAQIEDFLTKSIGSTGFSEYLQLQTPESARAKERLTRMYKATTVRDLMCPISAAGEIVDAKNKDTQVALRIFFSTDREGGSDALYTILENMKTVSETNYEINNLELLSAVAAPLPAPAPAPRVVGGITYYAQKRLVKDPTKTPPENEYKFYTDAEIASGSFVYKMSQILADMDTTSFEIPAGASEEQKKKIHEDRLAALLIMKKRVLSEFKTQMNVLVNNSGKTLNQFYAENPTFIEDLKAKWENIAKEIDAKIVAESAYVDQQFKRSGTTWTVISKQNNVNDCSAFITSKTLGGD